jgi:hypothetical protein
METVLVLLPSFLSPIPLSHLHKEQTSIKSSTGAALVARSDILLDHKTEYYIEEKHDHILVTSEFLRESWPS